MFVCSGIRSVSFYEHIVTVGTGLGSLLFYDIRAQRFLEKSLNLTSGYRKCPGEGILKLTTGTGWVVRSPFHLCPDRSLLPACPNSCFGFRITTRRGGVTSQMFIPSPTRSTRTATTALALSCSWRAGRCVPACTATTQGCGASLPFFLHLCPSAPSILTMSGRHHGLLDFSSSFNHHCSTHTWTQEHDLDPTSSALNIVVCFRARHSHIFFPPTSAGVFIWKCTDLLRRFFCCFFPPKAAESATWT